MSKCNNPISGKKSTLNKMKMFLPSSILILLLRALLASPQKVYAREELVERAYGHGHHITERTVDSHVRRIRKKFASVGTDPIETVYGVGYRLRDPEAEPS